MKRNFKFEKRVLDAITMNYMKGKLADPDLIYKLNNRGDFDSHQEFTMYIMELERLGYVMLTPNRMLKRGNKFEEWEDELDRC